MLLYMLTHQMESYDAEVIDKQETEQGSTFIKIRFTNKNNEVITKELPAPPNFCNLKIGDMIRISTEE